ncbi:stalk domain-containing protein [Paenibacillus woosongensis]|uniref:Copper amine oxidase n=1 Tax=Paenibacillus woosongensis TaxID=307580 RepID=A0A7X2Z285_9BACL|nr:stalk domain-containing protein [Paenibacillus woosongensis]MUG45536.1 copper amine oxidase [Paenibacillus woosongensis]
MKKWVSISAAFLLGVVVALSARDVSAQVKSLIGKKVTGEYEMVVNGNTLSEKGAIIDGRANVPARAFSEALGADVQVSGKTIYVTSTQSEKNTEPENIESNKSENKYIGSSKDSLEELKLSIENNQLKRAIEGRNNILAEIEQIKEGLQIIENAGIDSDDYSLKRAEARLTEQEEIIKKVTEDLRLVEEALAQFRD